MNLLHTIAAFIVALGVLIVVHEYGHYLAINRAGCGPSRIYMIPFLGGMATMPKPAPDALTGVIISLAGPALGITASLPFFALNLFTGDPVWLEGAFFIAVINLLNLFPAPPLDGSKALGPVLAHVHPMLERGVAVALAGVAVLWCLSSGSYVIGVLIALSVAPIVMGRPMRHASETPLTSSDAVQAVGLYLATAALCVAALMAVGFGLGLENPLVLLTRLV